MNDDRTHLTTLTHHFENDVDGVDIDPTTVDVYADTEPPDELADAVHAALDRTVLHLLDGREVIWRDQDDGGWTMSVVGGFPGVPRQPAYQTREQFEGADASGDGLLGNLPDGWSFDLKNRGTFVFYQD